MCAQFIRSLSKCCAYMFEIIEMHTWVCIYMRNNACKSEGDNCAVFDID